MESSFTRSLALPFSEEKFITAYAPCWVNFCALESLFLEVGKYFCSGSIFIWVAAKPVTDVCHEAHTSERSVLADIGDGVYPVESETDYIVGRV